METKEIIESGFVKAFITEYFEYKSYSFYPDKDRLLYVFCSTDIEKQQVTAKQIEVIKDEIQMLGNEELSFAYLLSCKPESISGHNFIEPDERFDFWLNRFCEEIQDHILYFDPITKAVYLFNEVSELTSEVFENENEFWEWYPEGQCPKVMYLLSNILNEEGLLSLIEYDIQQYKKNKYWELDFEEYKRFIDVSKPVEILFNLSELLVQLNRIEMFNEFFEIESLPLQQIKTENEAKRYTAKHYVLAYLIECNAKGERFPIGQKKKLEKIGIEKMGVGKGNRFYKVFNEVTNRYDINIENQLIEIGGENWRKAVIELSTAPELVEKYLQIKQL